MTGTFYDLRLINGHRYGQDKRGNDFNLYYLVSAKTVLIIRAIMKPVAETEIWHELGAKSAERCVIK